MNTPHLTPRPRKKGSALITVIILGGIMALLTASMLKYTISERRFNERQRLTLRARNMAENVSVYAAEQLTTRLMRTRSFAKKEFTAGSNPLRLPPDDVLRTSFSNPADVELHAGLRSSTGSIYINPTTDPTNPNAGLHVSSSDIPIIAKSTMTHPAVGTVTAYCEHTMEVAMIPLFQFGMFYNMDLELFPGQDMIIAGPVHTNGRLLARGEIGGAADITFTSRVTVAKALYADGQVKANYRNRSGNYTSGAGGSGAVNYTKTPTNSAPNGTQINLYGGSPAKWRDHKMGAPSESATTLNQFKTFATSTYTGYLRTSEHGVTALELPGIGTYKETDDPATTDSDPNTDNDDRNFGRELIEPLNAVKFINGTWRATTDDADMRETKLARKAGLYIVVNPDDEPRSGRLPDGSGIYLLPYTYRCFLNTVNADGSNSTQEVILPGQPYYGHRANNLADPNDDEMYRNNFPNRYTTNTSVGLNQVLRIPEPAGRSWDDADAAVVSGGLFPSTTGYPTADTAFPTLNEGIFYDLRRATNWRGYPYNRSATNSYTPRPIAKIDFDMARFKMCFDRTIAATTGTVLSAATTTTGYNVHNPRAWASSTNNYWGNSIYNPSATTMTLSHGVGASFATFPDGSNLARQDPFRMYFAPVDPEAAATQTNILTNPSIYGVGGTDLVQGSSLRPWVDGISIYLHSVDAERRGDGPDAGSAPDRIDSGVRLWNGRGPIVSVADTARTGFTFVTNDAAYIIGHYNANGAINTSTAATGNAGYSARYPDSNDEKLCAVMADAITLLSQPTFQRSGSSPSYKYWQVAGWSDAKSAQAADNGDELTRSTNWRTSDPSSSNEVEGEGGSVKPGRMPNDSTPTTETDAGIPNTDEKLPTVSTEFSTALLMGLIPSNHNASGLTDGPPGTVANQQYSGGAHNFPRLLEDWHNQLGSTASSTLSIRGSMVALFESRVAMEPWNIRCYLAPVRVWGLHEGFAAASHHLPLEPVVLNSRRMRYRELTSDEYVALKTEINNLPD